MRYRIEENEKKANSCIPRKKQKLHLYIHEILNLYLLYIPHENPITLYCLFNTAIVRNKKNVSTPFRIIPVVPIHNFNTKLKFRTSNTIN